MDTYLSNQDYKASWMLQETINSEKRPGMRGGHQLIIDSTNSVMYLYGGWDGFEDLSDLWCYNIKRNAWSLIHERSELFEGPSPRSCHKMVYDPCTSQIFTLGRYLDSNTRMQEYIKVNDTYLRRARFTWSPHSYIARFVFFFFAERLLFVWHEKQELATNLRWHKPSGWPQSNFRPSNVYRCIETNDLCVWRANFDATECWWSIESTDLFGLVFVPYWHEYMDADSGGLWASDGGQSRGDDDQVEGDAFDAVPSCELVVEASPRGDFYIFFIFAFRPW